MGRLAPLALLVLLALIGFASNSLLCRAALLHSGTIDPISFTGIRIASGALMLTLLASLRSAGTRRPGGTWRSAIALFVYAIAFSLAYVQLSTATGALILFTTVQLTMIGSVLLRGDRLRATQTTGLAIALAGLVVLCAPGVRAPRTAGAVLMSVAGVACGVSIRFAVEAAPIRFATRPETSRERSRSLRRSRFSRSPRQTFPSAVRFLPPPRGRSLPDSATASGTRRCRDSPQCEHRSFSCPCRC